MLLHNKYHGTAPSNAIYIGRGSDYGNPFVIGQDGTREEVIAKYKAWLLSKPELINKIKDELPGKHLVCFCKPQRCHGDVILELLNKG